MTMGPAEDLAAVPGCLFCGIVAGDVPADKVVETDLAVAFRDINPQAPVHILVVPRRHVDHAGVLTDDHGADLAAVFAAARQVAALEGLDHESRGYRLVFNVGPDAQNSVPHLHLHVVGGRALTWPPG
jgi:histidine triad (HIT) family protein